MSNAGLRSLDHFPPYARESDRTFGTTLQLFIECVVARIKFCYISYSPYYKTKIG